MASDQNNPTNEDGIATLTSTTRVQSLMFPSSRHRLPCLLFVTGADAGRLLALNPDEGPIVIGRGEDADIQLDSPEISRHHTKLEWESGGNLVLTDLDSKNSTFVNDEVVKRALIRADDKLRIGPYLALRLTYQDDEEIRQSRELFDRAVSDPLTGIFNRRFFMTTLNREWAFAGRHGHGLSLAMLDIDDFKSINDTYGHQAGDDILCGFADRVQTQTRIEDLMGRYGGDEFFLMLRQTDLLGAKLVAERVRRAVQAEPILARGDMIPITVSVGVAGFDHEHLLAAKPDELITLADQQLLLAKRQGRNTVCG